MKLKKYIHIRDKETEKQQLIPLYSIKEDVGKNGALKILVGEDVAYAKLVNPDDKLSSKLMVRVKDRKMSAEKNDEDDTIPLSRLHYIIKYNQEKHEEFAAKADEIAQEMLAARSSRERTSLAQQRGRFQHLAKITEFASSLYRKDHAQLPNPIDISALDDTSYMFYGCTKLKDVQELDTANVKDMRSMFEGCKSLPKFFPWYIDASEMDEIEKYRDMFKDSSVEHAYFKNVPEKVRGMLSESAEIVGLDMVSSVDVQLAQDKYKMKDLYADYETRESFDASFGALGMASIMEMYDGCRGLKRPASFDTSGIRSFERMFYGCKSLPEDFPYAIDVSGIKSSEDLRDMFAESSVKNAWFRTKNPSTMRYVTGDLLGNGASSKVDVVVSNRRHRMKTLFPESYSEMEENCWHPNRTTEFDILPMEGMTDASFMFEGCSSLMDMNSERLLSLHGLKDTAAMFQDCESLEDMPAIDTSACTNVSYMYSGCASLANPVPLDTRAARSAAFLFDGCESLPEIYPFMFDVESITYEDGLEGMFGNTPVREVSLLNLDAGVRNRVEPSLLGENIETIRYYVSLDWVVKDSAARKLNLYNALVIRDREHSLCELSRAEEIGELIFENIADARYAINGSNSLTAIGKLSGTDRIKNMADMFSGCRRLRRLPPVDVSGITDAQDMKDMLKGTLVTQLTLTHASAALKAELTPEILGSEALKISYE